MAKGAAAAALALLFLLIFSVVVVAKKEKLGRIAMHDANDDPVDEANDNPVDADENEKPCVVGADCSLLDLRIRRCGKGCLCDEWNTHKCFKDPRGPLSIDDDDDSDSDSDSDSNYDGE